MTSGFQLNNVEPPFFEWGHRAKLRGCCMCGRHDSFKALFAFDDEMGVHVQGSFSEGAR